jgi:ubiquinone/menaquinone biosynthesis C-methylase UbiE
MEKLKQYLIEQNKKSFLDIGTGNGGFISFIKSIYDGFETFEGIDVVKQAIEFANKNNDDERIQFKVMDGYEMEYPDNSFDVICLSNSLHHLKDITKMLIEMRRVMKDDGFILINEMISNDLDEMQISHLKLHHFSAKIDRYLGDTHYDTFTSQEIIEKLTNETRLRVEFSRFLEVPRRSENTNEEREYIANIMERVFARTPKEYIDELISEKDEILEYISKNGYDGATSLVVVLRK